MKRYIYLFLLPILACNPQETSLESNAPKGPWFGIEPTSEPAMLLPGVVSTRFGEYNGCFGDDGKRFYYSVSLPGYDAIMEVKMLPDSSWSEPEIASFSGKYEEYDPLISPDGQRLLISSHRPVGGIEPSDRSRIFMMKKEPDGNWSEPEHLFLGDNGEYFSSITNDGTIYYNVWNDGDMYKATPFPNGYATERLNDTLNSTNGDGDPFIALDESYLIFRSYRDGGFGNGDLYISFMKNKQWTIPQNLGEPINSSSREMTPYVTPDGKYFIFASNRFSPYSDNPPTSIKDVAKKYDTYDNGNQNIYVMSALFIETLREKAMEDH